MSDDAREHSDGNAEASREQFADGSSLVTYLNGSVWILESNLSREAVLRESRTVNYNDPPPPPPMKA